MAAADQVGGVMGVSLTVKVTNKLEIRKRLRVEAGLIAWVEADAAIAAEAAEQLEKITFAAANLDDVLAVQIMPAHQRLRKRPGIRLKLRREEERVLVALGVFHPRRIECRVEDMV